MTPMASSSLGTLCGTSDEIYNYGFANFEGFPNTRDLGLVILGQPITLSECGQLPAPGPGTLDSLSTARERLMGLSTLVNLKSAENDGFNLQTQGNGNGCGGTCSGGPVFLGGTDSNLIVGVTSFGLNQLCRGRDFACRIDRQEVLDWIANPS
jgi:hypothetical protein